MKRIILSAAMVIGLGAAAIAQQAPATFTLQKGAIVAEDFGSFLGRSELRNNLKARGIISHKNYSNLGNTYLVSGARWQGKTYRMKVDRRSGEVIWIAESTGLYSRQKP